jgi:aspartyl/glutamyl-tRNA(Asn/Gln) amidotransferase C subunit
MKKPDIDIVALAKLARLDVSSEELTRLEKEIPDILTFVQTIENASADAGRETPYVRNVMRPDEAPHESGIHTETLLKAAPSVEGGRIAVKQVISRQRENRG